MCYICVVCHNMFKHIFNGLEAQYPRELAIIREQYPSEPVEFTDEPLILHWHEAMNILKENNVEVVDDKFDRHFLSLSNRYMCR